MSLLQSLLHNAFGALAILLFGAVTFAGVRYLGYAEFAATGRFLLAGLRPMLGAHVKLELLERGLNSAQTVDQCWQVLERSARSLGYSHLAARMGDARYTTGAESRRSGAHWQMRLNPAADCWVNITQREGVAEPLVLIPFAEIVRRCLPRQLRLIKETERFVEPPLRATPQASYVG